MKIVKEFILREIVGEYVLVPTGDTTQEFNGMITINDTAKFIWENLEKVDSFEEMVKKVLDEYDVDEMTAKQDVYSTIHDLVREGLIVCTKEDKTW